MRGAGIGSPAPSFQRQKMFCPSTYVWNAKKTKGCEGVYNVTRKNPKVRSPQRDGIHCYKEDSAWSVLVTRDAAFVSYAMDATSSYQRSGENQMGKEDVKVACPNVVANVAKRSCEVHTLIFNGA